MQRSSNCMRVAPGFVQSRAGHARIFIRLAADSAMAKILLLEDDSSLRDSIASSLEARNHVVEQAGTASDALDRLAVSEYDVLVCDWNLPDGSGVQVLQSYRAKGGAARVLMLTAKADISDKETGFISGADDYLTKPFLMRELLVRIDALLRRSRETQQELSCNGLTLHPETFRVFRGDEELQLLPKEFALLEFLMRHPDKYFSAEQLLERVWRSDSESLPDAVVTTVKRLRRKIDVPGNPSVIENTRGLGYKLPAKQSNQNIRRSDER